MAERSELDELLEMCFYGHLDQVSCLLKEGANINGIGKNGMTPLLAALGGDNFAIVKFLVNKGADVNQGDWTILHEAFDYAIDGMIQDNLDKPDIEVLSLIEFLLENGADLNKLDDQKRTPLDSMKIYAGSRESFNKLKDFFRPIISDIDQKIKY